MLSITIIVLLIIRKVYLLKCPLIICTQFVIYYLLDCIYVTPIYIWLSQSDSSVKVNIIL